MRILGSMRVVRRSRALRFLLGRCGGVPLAERHLRRVGVHVCRGGVGFAFAGFVALPGFGVGLLLLLLLVFPLCLFLHGLLQPGIALPAQGRKLQGLGLEVTLAGSHQHQQGQNDFLHVRLRYHIYKIIGKITSFYPIDQTKAKKNADAIHFCPLFLSISFFCRNFAQFNGCVTHNVKRKT